MPSSPAPNSDLLVPCLLCHAHSFHAHDQLRQHIDTEHNIKTEESMMEIQIKSEVFEIEEGEITIEENRIVLTPPKETVREENSEEYFTAPIQEREEDVLPELDEALETANTSSSDSPAPISDQAQPQSSTPSGYHALPLRIVMSEKGKSSKSKEATENGTPTLDPTGTHVTPKSYQTATPSLYQPVKASTPEPGTLRSSPAVTPSQHDPGTTSLRQNATPQSEPPNDMDSRGSQEPIARRSPRKQMTAKRAKLFSPELVAKPSSKQEEPTPRRPTIKERLRQKVTPAVTASSQSPQATPISHPSPSPPKESNTSLLLEQLYSRVTAFQCSVCSKVLARKAEMSEHIMTVHVREGVKSSGDDVICVLCDKAFSTRGSMTRHVKAIHSRERPVSCEECGRRFANNFNLRSHLQYKHGGLGKMADVKCED